MHIVKDSIYHESCTNTLARMETDSVDLTITSPPYNMNLRITRGKYVSRQIVKELSTKYNDFNDNVPLDDYYLFHTNVLTELIRVSKRVFYNIQVVTGSKRAFFKIIGKFSDYLKDIIVWDKEHGQPAMQSQVLNSRYELILVFEKDYPISRQFRHNGNFKRGTLDNLWSIKRGKPVSGHGAVFPEELVATILTNFSKEGDIIYDPFMGTGTTAVVAKRMKRHFIGSEISADYIEIAKNRLKHEDEALITLIT